MGIRGIGPTPAEAFAQAALAMTAVTTDLACVEACEQVSIECEAPSLEELFFDWIDALVFEMSTRNMLFGRFDVVVDGDRLSARIWGERVDRARHEPAVEIKGPTYTELSVSHDESVGGWIAQCVVDV
jgi:tRNA nucleotidyltransferase (CCA-adding enzyme)